MRYEQFNENSNLPKAGGGYQLFCCEKRFETRSDLQLHTLSVHEGKTCPICEGKFPRKSSLDNHMARAHGQVGSYNLKSKSPEKTFDCSICKKRFTSKHGLSGHIENIHNIKDCKCKICDAIYPSKHALENHVETVHEGKRPFKCLTCGFGFTDRKVLYKHVEVVHDSFKCQICNYNYGLSNIHDLEKHLEIVHKVKKSVKSLVSDEKKLSVEKTNSKSPKSTKLRDIQMKKEVEIQDALEEMNNGDRKSEDISETTNVDMILGF